MSEYRAVERSRDEEYPLNHPAPRRARRSAVALALCAALIGAPATALGQVEAAEAAYRQARKSYKEGDYDAAIRFLQEAWRADQEPIFRYQMARSYEAAGRQKEAMQAAMDFISLLAEKGATTEIYRSPLRESWRLIERIRVETQAGPLNLTLPLARVCPTPVVTYRGEQLETRREGLYWQVTVPPITGAGGDMSVRCSGLEPERGPASFTELAYPYFFGAGGAAALAGGYFALRYVIADGELASIEPPADAVELGPTARKTTRTRQARDTYAESALIWGGVGVGLLVAGTVMWVISEGEAVGASSTVTPAATPDGAGAGFMWQGRF